MGHNIWQKEKKWSQNNMIRSCLSSFIANFRALKHNAKVMKVSGKFPTCV